MRVIIDMKSLLTFVFSFVMTSAIYLSAGISAPSWARDTDIYSRSDSAHSTDTIKPNVLLVLDNSQSMLAPDGWKEYPGEYDPNVEYLWNYSTSWNPSQPVYKVQEIEVDSATWQGQIDTQIGVNTNPMGFIADGACDDSTGGSASAGDIAEVQERMAAGVDTCSNAGFKSWILEWTQGKEGVGAAEDWDTRAQLRNYDRRVFHWLPAGTPETDKRLVSPSMNTFEADDFVDNGIRALIDFDDSHRRDYNLSTDRNRCVASRRHLNESGVLTPGVFFSQAEIDELKSGDGLGKYLGKKWLRWDRYSNPKFQNEFQYPGTTGFNTSWDTKWTNGLRAPNEDGYMDSDRMPIRGKTDDGYASWAPLRADGGGWRGISLLRRWSNDSPSSTSPSDRKINRLMENLYPGFDMATDPSAYQRSYRWWWYAMTNNQESVPNTSDGQFDVSKFWAPWGYESRLSSKQVDRPSCGNPNNYSRSEGWLGTFVDYAGNSHRYYDESVATQTCEGGNASISGGYCDFRNGNENRWKTYSTWKWINRSYFTNEQGEVFGYGGQCVWNNGTTEADGAVRDQARLDLLGNGPSGVSQPYWVKKDDEDSYCRAGNNERQYCEDMAGADNNCRFNRQCVGISTDTIDYWRRVNVTWQAFHDCIGDEDSQGLDMHPRNWNSWSPRWASEGTSNYSRTIESRLANDPSLQLEIGYETRTGAEIKVKPPAIDVYSANYLNWKFGVKGPNGHPVGRMTRMSVAKKALSAVIEENDGVRFGLMVFNSADNLGNADGGKVVFGVADMTDANKAALLDTIAKVEANSSTPLAEAMYEAKLYFAGEAPWKGTSESGYDSSVVAGGKYVSPMFDNPSTADPAQCQKNYSILVTDGDPEFDTNANTQIASLSHTQAGGTVISPNQNLDTNSPRSAVLSPNESPLTQFAGRIDTTQPSPVPDLAHKRLDNEDRFSWLDELTYFMKNADLIDTTSWAGQQNVTNFVIGFSGASSEVLKASATFSEDDSDFYTADSTESLKNAIQAALQGIRRWTPVRSAPVVGINSKNRAETGDDVYMAFFEPGDSANWRGTLKRYKLYTELQQTDTNGASIGYDRTQLTCAQPSDADGPATDSTPVGAIEISECLIAVPQGMTHDESTWDNTFEGVDLAAKRTLIAKYVGLQSFEPATADSASSEPEPKLKEEVRDLFVTDVNHQDNAKGDSGGTGWKLIQDWLANNSYRKIYARIDTGTSDLTDAANSVVSGNVDEFSARFGIDTSEALKNIQLARGLNPDTGTRMDWMHGDILHSKPVMVHYDGAAETPTQSTLFYLSNDGLLRAVDAMSGRELWAFLVDEALCKYELGPNVNCAAAGSDPTRLFQRFSAETGSEHIVLADGPLALDIHDRSGTSNRRPNGIIQSADGDRVTLVFGLRRGGRAYYALDVTDRLQPKFMWKKDPSSGGVFSLLGQTWSKPTLGMIRGHYETGTRVHKPVAIFAGGYDPSFDYEYGQLEDVSGIDTATYPRVANLDRGATIGLGVYVLDLLSGDLVRWFGPGVIADGSTNTYSGWASSASYKTDEAKMKFAIPSDLVGLNVDLDTRGYIDTAFVGDLGGQLWRINLDPMDPGEWNVRQIANLSGDLTQGSTTVSDNDMPRAIFYPPAVVKDTDHLKVVVGTGAQELPLLTETQDIVAMIKDGNITIDPSNPAAVASSDGTLRAPATYLNSTLDGLDDAFAPSGLTNATLDGASVSSGYDAALTTQIARVDSAAVRGWVSRLAQGEKATGAPQVFKWWATVPTWTPTLALNACTPAGLGRLRAFDAKAGAAAIVEETDANGDKTYTFKTTLGPSARGYVDNSTLIFQDGEVRRLVNADGVTAQQSMNMQGVIETEYWYRELQN